MVEPRGHYEPGKQRVAVTRVGSEFRVKLAGNEPGMARYLDHLDQIVHRYSGKTDAGLLEDVAVVVVDFITVPVALVDLLFPVNRCSKRASDEIHFLCTEAHGATQI